MEGQILYSTSIDSIKESIRESILETLQDINISGSTPISHKEVMTVDEVAEYLGVKPQTIYNYKNAGKIPYTKKIGLRFIKSQIDKWLLEGGEYD